MHVILLPIGKGLFATVDSDCPREIWESSWYASKMGNITYAARHTQKPDGSQTIEVMHRALMPGVKRVDHKNGDGQNNTRQNLRPATTRQNQQGFRHKKLGASSRYRGVCLFKRDNNWEARIRVDGKQFYLGHFESETDAAKAYDAAARKYFGEFASPNFPL